MLVIFMIVTLTVYAGAIHLIIKRRWVKRLQSLERDLQHLSDMMSQMADVQMRAQQKFSTNLEELEERIMELSVPSHDSSLPLERRHQVLSLARQGVALEDIAKRLKAPVGETELILNLRKYIGGESSRPAKRNEQVKTYA